MNPGTKVQPLRETQFFFVGVPGTGAGAALVGAGADAGAGPAGPLDPDGAAAS